MDDDDDDDAGVKIQMMLTALDIQSYI